MRGRRYYAGIDEAGLGPMLGPLVIGATLFSLPAGDDRPDLWKMLDSLVSKDPKERREKIVVCDSKQLHKPSAGLAPLEESLYPLLAAAHNGATPDSFHPWWAHGSLLSEPHLDEYLWYKERELTLPTRGLPERIDIRASKLADALKAKDVVVEGVGFLPVLVREFNRLARVHPSKSDINLSAMAVAIDKLWRRCGDLTLYCDRLGARRFYKEALKVHLKPDSGEVVKEGQQYSAYRLRRKVDGAEHTLQISFSVNADQQHFPVALASMAAKYARELIMTVFNNWFCAQQEGLKPTKGYVTDARRWLADTETLRRELKVSDEMLIRVK